MTTRRLRPLPARKVMLVHAARNAGLFCVVIGASLAVGALGYHRLEGLPWIDATLNASMILTGMGPLAPLTTTPAKLFGILYALFSGVVFLTTVAILLAPFARRFLHRFHLDMYRDEDDRD